MSVNFKQLNLVLIGVILLIGVSFFQVDALTKIEKDALKEQIEILEIRITNIENDIEKQKEIILEKKKFVEEKKAELKLIEQQARSSWDAVQKIAQAKQNIINAENEFAGAEEQLLSLLNTKIDYVSKLENYKISINAKNFEPQPVPLKQTIKNQTEIIQPAVVTNIIGKISHDLSGLKNNIGVTLSKSCLTMVKNNFKTTCPTYEDIVHLDSSNTNVSGEFVKTDGFFHRDKAQLVNSWRWYDMDQNLRVFIDPSGGMMDKVKMITIVPNLDTYYQKSDMIRKQSANSNMQEIILVLYHDRYVKGCKEATINAGGWKELLEDTIIYMQNDCSASFTEIETIELISKNKTQFDISTSQKWIHDKWLSWVKEFCIFSYGFCKD